MAAAGRGVAEIVSKLESRRNDVCLLTCLNSVEPLVQSGRMKKPCPQRYREKWKQNVEDTCLYLRV